MKFYKLMFQYYELQLKKCTTLAELRAVIKLIKKCNLSTVDKLRLAQQFRERHIEIYTNSAMKMYYV